ncbi:MAG: dehypoxanthine futalosine cyclase [Nitrospiraceae bacterium]|nr:dehypoxanthine futalosine cyclase [Nitrospiraceae bacterium]
MRERITNEDALALLKSSDLLDLGQQADEIRKNMHASGMVTFIVDRNINYTNVCINKCRFCAFYRDPGSSDAYVLSREELFKKIEETIALGGTQILIQGGLNPDLDLDYYIDLLKSIKQRYDINIHGFSPPEVCYLADKHALSISETISRLKSAGLDSIPGGGAEILSDRVRDALSPKKIKSGRWLGVMEEAHKLGMRTTATMMFGSVETPEEVIEHLDSIRSLQDRTGGFTAFIPWTFQPGNTELADAEQQSTRTENNKHDQIRQATAVDYLRVLALSRVYLDNIKNIQASWVTQGIKMAQIALRFGANDFGSTMIEENVVKAAGVSYSISMEEIVHGIRAAGFAPAQRDTYYKLIRKF